MKQKHHIALLCLLFVLAFSVSCQHNNDSKTAPANDSINWKDSCFQLLVKTNQFYNADDDSIIQFVPEAMEICVQHNQRNLYYRIWETLAEYYIAKDQYDKAADEGRRMQEEATRRQENIGLFMAYKTLGFGYAFSNKNKEAIEQLEKAINIEGIERHLLFECYRVLYYAQTNLGLMDAVDTTMARWKEDLKRYPITSNDKQISAKADLRYNFYIISAEQANDKERYDDMEEAIDSAAYYLEMSGSEFYNVFKVESMRSNLARHQGRTDDALKHSAKLLKMAEELNSNDKMIAFMERSRALEQAGRFEEALETYKMYQELSDSTKQEENIEKLNQLNKQYAVNELQSANKQIQQRSRFTTGSLAMIMGIVALLVFLVFSSRWNRQLEIKNRQLQRERNVVVAAHNKLKNAYQQLEETTTAKERIESELRIARDIQMSIVPSVFPQHEGLDLFGSMTPAKEVGGDLYDYLLDGDNLYFCVGDVSGKGVPASLFMAQVTRMFRIMAKQHQMPVDIATNLNNELSEDNENGMFVTMFIGLLNLTTGHLDFCNAGHNPPVLGGDEQHGSFIEMESNAPIGLWPGLQFMGEQIENITNHPLFIYTDGLNEAENQQQEQFGDEHLLDILRHTNFDSTRQVIDNIKDEVNKHRNGAEPNDDMTMLCINLTTTKAGSANSRTTSGTEDKS